MPGGKITFAGGHYLGGHPDEAKAKTGNLYFTDDCIGIGLLNPNKARVDWTDAASIEITSEQVAKSRAGAAALFGVGALATKGSGDKATIIVRTKDGHQVYYQLDKDSAHLRAKVATMLHRAGVPFYGEQTSSPVAAAAADPVTQLATLAQLKEAGHLSAEEFEAQKARILGI